MESAGMMLFRSALFFLIIGVVLLSAVSAQAEKRVALVIGNGAYKLGALKNPPNDAKLIGKTLRSLGFHVIERTDLTQRGMKRAISEFGTELANAGDDAVGMFFYAGHGVQAKGNNYLLPTDAELNKESDLELYAVRANWVLGQMEEAGNRVNLVVLDACRNNPFTRSWKRSVTRGLARMEAPRGTMIAYATRPGDVAADGKGNNSPYTKAFSDAIQTPGLTLSSVFIKTRNSVIKQTSNEQVPWEEGGLTAELYLAGQGNIQVAAIQPQSAVPIDEKAVELEFWQSVKDSQSKPDYEAYLSKYPNGAFSGLATARIAALTPSLPVAPSFVMLPLDEEMVALKTANIRSMPSVNGRKVGKVGAGRTVNVTGKTKIAGSDWYRVALSGGETGYVFGNLLKEQQVAAIAPVPVPVTAPPVSKPRPLIPSIGTFTAPGRTSSAQPGTTLPEKTPRQQYIYAFNLLREAKYDEAGDAMKLFVESNPDDPLAGNARYWLGETYYVRNRFTDAAATFFEGYRKDPKGPKATDSLLKLGMSLAELGKREEACVTFAKVSSDFPGVSANVRSAIARENQRNGCVAP
jgi:tol-pal system protein YbgF